MSATVSAPHNSSHASPVAPSSGSAATIAPTCQGVVTQELEQDNQHLPEAMHSQPRNEVLSATQPNEAAGDGMGSARRGVFQPPKRMASLDNSSDGWGAAADDALPSQQPHLDRIEGPTCAGSWGRNRDDLSSMPEDRSKALVSEWDNCLEETQVSNASSWGASRGEDADKEAESTQVDKPHVPLPGEREGKVKQVMPNPLYSPLMWQQSQPDARLACNQYCTWLCSSQCWRAA